MFVSIGMRNSLSDRKTLLGRRFMWMEWFQWHAFIKNMKIKSWHTCNWFDGSGKDTNVYFVASYSCSYGIKVWVQTIRAMLLCFLWKLQWYRIFAATTVNHASSFFTYISDGSLCYIISMLLDLVSVYIFNIELCLVETCPPASYDA